ncbi:MAG: heme lyase CcmF/NrfE family subunit [Anaerolineae bacterium]|nr:heme lyase CcmF/NrfE family subunit [Anaerolineae bacterium]MDW8071525.1 heme lyase CcmF/NrfE family subunit [Anaerolineae bacterium]
MVADLGYVALLLAFVLSIFAALAAWWGERRRTRELILSARNGVLAVAGLLTLAVCLELGLLLSSDFRVMYVAQVTNRAMPAFFKLTALWGGQAGSLLFWSWLMALFAAAAVLRGWQRTRVLIPKVIVVTQLTLAFFLSLIVGVWALLASPLEALGMSTGAALMAEMETLTPFYQLDFTPSDGRGLNPLLRHWGMIVHPPLLYLGFVGFVIPFAFAVAALSTRQTGDLWIRVIRRWTLVAWLFLSMGLLVGMWWAYGVLGWGGYWGWDPVENAALMPWLTGTAFLHSVIIQERRGMFKVWNMVLIMITYSLVIFGTFLTRSGVVSSVHAFAQSGIGPLFLGFVGITFVASVLLLFARLDSLRSENRLDSLVSREAIFLFNNLLFLAIFFVTLWGTIFPVVSELLAGQKAIVGPPFFNQVNGPLFALLVLTMGMAPLMPWRRTAPGKLARLLQWPVVTGLATTLGLLAVPTLRQFAVLPGTALRIVPVTAFYGLLAFTLMVIGQEFWRGIRARRRVTGERYATAWLNLIRYNRRRYGGYLVHVGVVMIALGVIGTHFFKVETQRNLARGESFTLTSPLTGSYTVTYEGLRVSATAADVRRTAAELKVTREGQVLAWLYPAQDFFIAQEQAVTTPAMRHSLAEDLYIILAGWENGGTTATFKAYVEPLVNWLWIGGLVFILGTAVAAWPTQAEERRTAVATEVSGHAVTARS